MKLYLCTLWGDTTLVLAASRQDAADLLVKDRKGAGMGSKGGRPRTADDVADSLAEFDLDGEPRILYQELA